VQYLSQFAMLGPVLPRWAFSRWLAAQAMQWLDAGSRSSMLTALQTAIEVRGEATVAGHDAADARARLIDHDWVFRQLVLYELGTLDRFCRKRAGSRLLVAADDMPAWSRARIDAYHLVTRGSATLTWLRDRDGELLSTPNTGCAAGLRPGDAVLGRLAPIEGGSIFESAPLPVSDAVARRVAEEPAAWLDAVRDWDEYADVVPLDRPTEHDGLLVELPPVIWQNVVCDQPDTYALRPTSPSELARSAVDFGRFLLEEFEAPDFRHLDTWACLAAALVEPAVLRVLSESTTTGDREVFAGLADTLAEPASTICRHLIAGDLPRAA
jgi:hypothetical protein